MSAVSLGLLADTRVGDQTFEHRRRAVWLHAGTGVTGALALSFLGQPFSRLLFTEDLAISTAISLPFGLAFLMVTANTYMTQQVLVPAGRRAAILGSVLAGSIVGVPATIVFSSNTGAAGGAWALVIAEVVTLLAVVLLNASSRYGAATTR